MIVAVVGVVHAYDLLPYYLSHYRALGVDEFAVICNPLELDDSGALDRWLRSQADVKVCPLPRGFTRSKLVGMIEEEIRSQRASADDWMIPADLDELNQYPLAFPELTRQMKEGGFTHVSGELRDRLTADGALTALERFERGISIWDQYPIDAEITARIAEGSTEKVLLSRGDLGWSVGHHQMRSSPDLKVFPLRGAAHHFKWRDGLAQTLEWRVENEGRARIPWSKESVRLGHYLREHGRIALESLNARIGWRPS